MLGLPFFERLHEESEDYHAEDLVHALPVAVVFIILRPQIEHILEVVFEFFVCKEFEFLHSTVDVLLNDFNNFAFSVQSLDVDFDLRPPGDILHTVIMNPNDFPGVRFQVRRLSVYLLL